jgi:hypothetical protein
MQHLDKNTLFSIFEAGDEEIYEEHNITHVLDNPFVLMGMVMRGLENWNLLSILYTRTYKQQFTSVEPKIKRLYFAKLCGYLERIGDKKFDSTYGIGDDYDTTTTIDGLYELLMYFTETEQYEKCVIVNKYFELMASNIIKRELSVNTCGISC